MLQISWAGRGGFLFAKYSCERHPVHSTRYLYIRWDWWRTGDTQYTLWVKLQFAGGHPVHSALHLYILGDRWRAGDTQCAFFIKLQFAGEHPVCSLCKVVDSCSAIVCGSCVTWLSVTLIIFGHINSISTPWKVRLECDWLYARTTRRTSIVGVFRWNQESWQVWQLSVRISVTVLTIE